MNVFFANDAVLNLGAESLFEMLKASLNDFFGALAPAVTSTTSSGPEPFVADFVDAVDQVSGLAFFGADFTQPLAVGTVLAAEDEHHVRFADKLLDGVLTVLRRVADVFLRAVRRCAGTAPSALG